MPVEVFANAANTTLLTAITVAGSTSFTVASGVKFPVVSVAAGTQFRVIIDSELFVVTDSSTSTWTVVPAAEGTTAATHLVAATVTSIVTAAGLGSKSPRYTAVFKTAAYTAVDGDNVVADTTAGSFTVTLPASVAGRVVGIRKIDASANVVTVATASGLIDGVASRPYPFQYQTQQFVCDGVNWQRLDVVGVTAMATTGTPSATTYLRGDGSWSTPAGSVNPADVGYDVILLAGQSNMSGSGGAATDIKLDPADPQLWAYNYSGTYGQMVSQALEPLVHADAAAGQGAGLQSARWIKQQLTPNRRVLVVPVAYGGTGLVFASTPNWSPSGTLFPAAVARCNAALAAAGPNSRVVGILWLQGEQDAQNAITAVAYATALDALIDSFRAQINGATSCPFVVISMMPEYVAGQAATIDTAHKATPTRKAYTAFAPGPVGYNADTYHYTPTGLRLLGRNVAEAFTQAKTNTAGAGTAPSRPLSVSAAVVSSTSVTVAWADSYNGGVAITGHKVYRSFAGGAEVLVSTIGAVLTFTDTGLTTNSVYTYRVTATNTVGESLYSGQVSVTPIVVTVPAQVTGLTATAGSTQVVLSWTAPANGGAAITDYIVQYRTPNGSGAYTTFTHAAQTVTTITVTGLTNASVYGFQVAAINSVGTGTFSTEATATPVAGTAVTDSFNRVNSATLGTADSGQVWTSGGFSIASNQAANTTAGTALAVIETGIANHTPQFTITAAVTGTCLVFRATDVNNNYAWNVGNGTLFKIVAGSFTTINTVAGATGTVGDVYKVTISVNTYTLFRNGTSLGSITDATYPSGTKAGMRMDASTGLLDNFSA